MIFGKKDRDWSPWLRIENHVSFRFGADAETNMDVISSVFHDVAVVNDEGGTNWTRTSRWFHRALSNGASVELAFPWLPVPRRHWFGQLWNYMAFCIHLISNPRGEGCVCWHDQED